MLRKLAPGRTLRNWVTLFFGLFFMASGSAFTIIAELGTSAISSVPYTLSQIVPMTVGNITIIMHAIFILIQYLLLRKDFEILQLLQLPVAMVFGKMIDLILWCLRWLQPTAYWQQWLLCLFGIVQVGLAVVLEVGSKTVPIAGEAIVLAFSQVTKIPFPKMKIISDVTLVLIACALSLIFLGKIVGVREGTVVAAFLAGYVVKLLQKPLAPLMPPLKTETASDAESEK